jgi:N-hydroxyarylamine O-acetyltransferase
MNIGDYLERIGYSGPARADLGTLSALQRAHMLSIPFENLDIALGRLIRLEQSALWDKVVSRRRGGFCYELNGMFAQLLKEIGFEVTYLNAVTYYPATDSFGSDFDHLALLVSAPPQSTCWLVDVGYGDNFTIPMNIEDPKEQIEGQRAYWIEPFKNGYQLWRRNYDATAQSQYNFDLTGYRFPSAYEAMCRYHQTSPDSFFMKRRLISRLTEDGRITLENQRMIVTTNGRKTETFFEESEFPSLLKKHFGVVL